MLIKELKEKYEQEIKNIEKNKNIMIEEKLNKQLLAYHFLVKQFLEIIETSSWENWFKKYALIPIKFYKEDNYDGNEIKIINKICEYLKEGSKQQKIPIFITLADIMFPLENTTRTFKLINEHGDIFCPECNIFDPEYMGFCYLCGSQDKNGKINIITAIESYGNELQILKNININKIYNGVEEFLNKINQ